MRRYRASWSGPDTFFADRSWADCITNMSGFDLRQAQLICAELLICVLNTKGSAMEATPEDGE